MDDTGERERGRALSPSLAPRLQLSYQGLGPALRLDQILVFGRSAPVFGLYNSLKIINFAKAEENCRLAAENELRTRS